MEKSNNEYMKDILLVIEDSNTHGQKVYRGQLCEDIDKRKFRNSEQSRSKHLMSSRENYGIKVVRETLKSSSKDKISSPFDIKKQL